MKSYVEVLGRIWMPAVMAAQHINLRQYSAKELLNALGIQKEEQNATV